MRKLIAILIIALAYSCNKQHNYSPSNFEDSVIVVKGHISDSIEIQQCQITFANDIGDTSLLACKNAEITVSSLSITNTFSHSANGTYLSDSPFALIPGSNYSIKITHNNKIREADSKMPYPINIDSAYNLGNSHIHLVLHSPKEQYLYYELQIAHLDSLDADTVWQNVNSIDRNVIPIIEGEQDVNLNAINYYGYSYIANYPMIKLQIQTLNADVAKYLLYLHEFSSSASNLSESKNPPAYFSNECYGLLYGSQKYEVIFKMD